MKKIVILASLCTFLSCGLAFGAADELTVREFLRVTGPDRFLCRIADWPNVGAVRSTVTVRGLHFDEFTHDQDAARDFLARTLSAADSIRLTNVADDGFFRVTAEVHVDGRRLATQMLSRGLAAMPQPTVQTPPVARPEPIVRPAAMERIRREVESRNTRPQSASPRARAVRLGDLLSEQVDLSMWTPDMPFEEALEMLRTSTDPALPMAIFWRDLEENAFVDKTTPIGLEGVGRLPVRHALRLLMMSVDRGRGDVDVVIEDGFISIASSQLGLGDRMITRVYNTAELTAPPSNPYGFGGMGGGMGMGGGYGGMGGMGMGGFGGGGMQGLGNAMGGMGPGFGGLGGGFGGGGFGYGY